MEASLPTASGAQEKQPIKSVVSHPTSGLSRPNELLVGSLSTPKISVTSPEGKKVPTKRPVGMSLSVPKISVTSPEEKKETKEPRAMVSLIV